MIANRYNQLLNNFKKIKLTANNNKKSLENIANLKKEFLKIKDFRKSSSNNKDKLFNEINIKINYQVIENELNHLRDIFLKDNLFDENEVNISIETFNNIFNITDNLYLIKEVFNKKTLIFDVLNLRLKKTIPVFSDLFINELNKILNNQNVKIINSELLEFKNNLHKHTTLFIEKHKQLIDKNKVDINILILNNDYVSNRLANQNFKNIYDYLKFTNIEISDLFKNFYDLLDKYDNHGISASNEINQLLTKKINELDFDNDIILKDIEAILILAKEKFDAATEVELAKKKAEKEAKKTAQEEEKAKQAAIREAKKLALEKAKKEAHEKKIKDQNEKERKSRNSTILGYFSIFIGVILCSWGLWELGSYLWDNYSTEIKWITVILIVGFIALLYFGDAKWLSFLVALVSLSLWLYFSNDEKPLSTEPNIVPQTINQNQNNVDKKNITPNSNQTKKNLVETLKSFSNYKLCSTATVKTRMKEEYQWDYRSVYSKKAIFEAKSRGLDCGVVSTNKVIPPIISKQIKQRKADFKEIKKGLNICPKSGYKDNCLGFLTDNNGKYEGNFKNNKKHGTGSYTWKNGNKYNGLFKNDYKTSGIYTYKNGTTFSGKFLNEKFHKGRELYVGKWAGDKYLGDFKNNKKHGKGTYFWKNGNKYIGEWKNDKLHGTGTLTYKNGKINKGTWENGKFMYGEADKIN